MFHRRQVTVSFPNRRFVLSMLVLTLIFSCTVPKKYQANKPFVYNVDIKVEGNMKPGEKKDRETLSIAVVDNNGPVADAKCILTNGKGDWSVTAPDSIEVRRSDSDLQIKCEKSGYDPVTTTIKAATTQIPRPQFHFAAGGSDDSDSEDAMITVPQYAPSITVTFGSKQANAN